MSSGGQEGLSLNELEDEIRYVNSSRGNEEAFDIVYLEGWPEDADSLGGRRNELESIGVTWWLEGMDEMR